MNEVEKMFWGGYRSISTVNNDSSTTAVNEIPPYRGTELISHAISLHP